MNVTDTEKITRLWTEVQPVVSSYVLSLCPDYHRAEDILQAVAVAIVKRFDTYDQARPFLPWVLGLAKIEIFKSRDKVIADRHQFVASLADQLEIACCEEAKSEEVSAVRHALTQCLHKQRGRILHVLRLRYAQGLKTADVAQRMGATPGAVRVLLHRAHASLRECISKRIRSTST